jgi:glycosyltransferase involved in cell wall biosynthesis
MSARKPASPPSGRRASDNRITTSCIINNYNYRDFVVEACESALRQTRPFDQILVVDDGSIDGSQQLLRDHYGDRENLEMIFKRNEGQLSTFNAGFEAARGELVFFLDADDAFEAGYAAAVVDTYEQHPDIDFLFCAHRKFGEVEEVEGGAGRDRDLGYSVIYTLFARRWIGAPTSCLSMRRSVLERILPVPHLEDWRTRADDCLVLGASAVGARKFYLDRPLVRYRIHAKNLYMRRRYDKVRDYRRKLAVNRLLHLLVLRMGYDRRRLSEFAHREFRTISRPDLRQLRDYMRIAGRADVGLGRRLAIRASMMAYYAGQRLLGRPAESHVAAASIPSTPRDQQLG